MSETVPRKLSLLTIVYWHTNTDWYFEIFLLFYKKNVNFKDSIEETFVAVTLCIVVVYDGCIFLYKKVLDIELRNYCALSYRIRV